MVSLTKYREIAHDLREAIVSGDYAPGSTLPAIPDIMAKYEVARDTVRDAINQLTNEGLVTPRRGLGTVVRETAPVALRYTANGQTKAWHDQTEGAGRDEIIEAGWEAADRDIAARLSVAVGTRVLRRVRHFTRGHGVAQISEQWVPEAIVQAIADDELGDLTSATNRPDSATDIFTLMSQAGHPPAEVTEDVTTRMPDPRERDAMELPPGVPVLVTRRITRERDGTPIETTTAIGAGDRMSASFTVPLSPKQ